jgi:hypothetical protein
MKNTSRQCQNKRYRKALRFANYEEKEKMVDLVIISVHLKETCGLLLEAEQEDWSGGSSC